MKALQRRYPQVEHLDLRPRPPAASRVRRRWARLFVKDYLLGLTAKPDSEGDVVIKSRFEGPVGDQYRSIYAALAEEITAHFGDVDHARPTPVCRVDADAWSPADFRDWRRRVGRPLVIRGLLDDSEAVATWSAEWLARNRGHADVEFLDLKEFDRLLDGGKSLVGENLGLEHATLRDFLTEERYRGHYINNHNGVFSEEDFQVRLKGERLDEMRGKARLLDQWFISRSTKSGSPVHAASGDNLFVNIQGRKEWHFIAPEFTPYMLPAVSRFGAYGTSEVGRYGLDDLEDVYARYPHMRSVPSVYCVLEPGDVLYNPPWWWHNVQNRSEFTLGCATRYLGFWAPLPIFACQAIESIRHPTRSILAAVYEGVNGRRGMWQGTLFNRGR